ncbi:MAG: putative sulfate exporter family transporter [Nitrospirae bacterium]|nr:putative sulfate exporter family transporter [Nitrospirota bacterium]MBF0535589.1 putative sulfate exporter family transporter [Nitrospirota bacterium]MBF0617472.1 putative sulfate exporter family transporter [Nitrospirota bacterium]
MEKSNGGISEDWLSLLLGIFIFIVSLGIFFGSDLLGWGISTKVWMDPSKAMSPVSKHFQSVKGEITKIEGSKLTLKHADGKEEAVTVKEDVSTLKVGDKYEKQGVSGFASLFFTYAAMLVIMLIGAGLMRVNVGKFAIGFTVIFWLSYLCWLTGHYAHIAATKNQLANFKISWALSLTGEAGFIVALIAGLIVGNFFPGLAGLLKEASKPELYIKTAIVIMGAMLGLKAAESFTLASAVLFRGFCAIVEAYLIYWAVVYYIARKYFKFSSEWAAPLAAGISICGVSAAIAVGGAIRARPVVPIMVSSLVVIFAVVEMLILPFAAEVFLWKEPLVAGAWMGLAVKTDGGAVASGAITDALIRAKALDMTGVKYTEGWITMASTTVKMFIDVFIGVWAFVLAIIWCAKIECKEGEKVKVIEIWQRFPKFVIGYVLTFILFLALCFPFTRALAPVDKEVKKMKDEVTMMEKKLVSVKGTPEESAIKTQIEQSNDKIKALNGSVKEQRAALANAKLSTDESNTFRVMFFVLTFFTIGLVSNFKKLWEEGIGKLAAVYVLCLFGFIIWVGLFISWLFFHGVKPPVITG